MAQVDYNSKFTGAELDGRLERVNELAAELDAAQKDFTQQITTTRDELQQQAATNKAELEQVVGDYKTETDSKLTELESETDALSIKTMSMLFPTKIDVTKYFVREAIRGIGSIKDEFDPTASSLGKYCAIFRVKIGDEFDITNLKGASSVRAWVKYNKQGVFIASSDANVEINGTLTMEHDGYLMLNHYGAYDDVSLKVVTNAELIPINAIVGVENLYKDLDTAKNNVPKVVSGFGEDESKAVSQSFINDVLFPLVKKVSITELSKDGYLNTVVGEAPSVAAHAVRRHIILDVNKGDMFFYDALGGSAGRAIAFVKNGIVTYVSASGNVKETVYVDGTYDQIIFNYDSSSPATILRVSTTINIPQLAYRFGNDTTKAVSQSFFTEALQPIIKKVDLSEQSEAGYLKTSVGVAPSLTVHAVRRHIILDVQKGDIFSYDATGGSAGRAIAYVKDGIVTYASDSGAIKAEVVADGTYDQIIFNYDSSLPYTIVKFGDTVELPKNEYEKPLKGKNVVIFGDSSTAGSASSGTNWFNRMCEDLGAENYRNYASGGQTILNQEGVTTNYLKASIETAISNINSQWGGKVDVIMLQIGGNDIDHMSQKGTLEEAFSSYNYLDKKDDKTIYGSLRYCLEHLRRTFPNALITMGTVFGRLGTDIYGGTKEINEIITNCCDVLKIQVIDGGRHMGFSYLELGFPYYNDANKGVANDRTALTRDNPAYNYLDANGNIVTYEEATNDGTLKSGYTKRYGLYTYDGKHQSQQGEDKVKKFMQLQIASLVI